MKNINKIKVISWSNWDLISKDFNAVSLINETIKTVKLENIDDTDEYLKISETTTQVKIKSKLNWIDKANSTPRYVATPFPPLKFSHTGNKCPKKTIRHDNGNNSGKYLSVMVTAM